MFYVVHVKRLFLTEVFLRLKHPATYRAIQRIAAEGVTSDILQATFALRDSWMERPEWWVGRYGPSREVRPLRQGSRGLSWTVAVRICRSRLDYAPEDMIDEDWFHEWLHLSPGIPGYLLFAEYVNAKVTDPDVELLHEGLRRLEQADCREDLGEFRGWWRTLPRYDEDIRFGFSVLTPFRDGFAPPGYPENQEPFRGARSDT
jgi:hypothetical protein